MKEYILDRVMVDPNSGCWLWTGWVKNTGYGLIKVYKGSDIRAHRLSYELFVGPIPDTMLVLHKCDVRCCVNPNHLFLGTQRENMKDMALKGRTRPPDTRGKKKISREMALEVKRMLFERISCVEIARRLGIVPMDVYSIKRGTSWKYLEVAQKSIVAA